MQCADCELINLSFRIIISSDIIETVLLHSLSLVHIDKMSPSTFVASTFDFDASVDQALQTSTGS